MKVGHEVVHGRAGTTACLPGNVAIVRGALEAGVQFVSGYPGTPASEIGDTFARIATEADVLFEYSVNEKIAVEIAFAASPVQRGATARVLVIDVSPVVQQHFGNPRFSIESCRVQWGPKFPNLQDAASTVDLYTFGVLLGLDVLVVA